MKPVYYAVTMYVNRPHGDKEEMLRHYKANNDPMIIFNTEGEMREHQRKALIAAFGK